MASQPRFTQSSLGTQLEPNPLFCPKHRLSQMNTMVINYENTVDLSRMNLNTDTWYFSTETVFVNISIF